MIKVRVQSEQVVEGTIFAVDPITSSLILKTTKEDSSYTLIPACNIIDIEGDIDLSKLPNIVEMGVNFTSLEKYEVRALEQAERSIAALNFNVTPVIQTLFDRLNFIFPCHWRGVDIVILNEFIIQPPYDSVTKSIAAITTSKTNSKNSSNGNNGSNSASGNGSDTSAGMERVIKVLKGERKKLKL